jgi:sirohydrochlorin ferrochelatase
MTEMRLRWWAVLLPAAVFAALLTLLVTGTRAETEAAGGRHAVTQPVTALADQLRQALFP